MRKPPSPAEGRDDADLPLSRAGADCYGEAWVDVVGAEALVDEFAAGEDLPLDIDVDCLVEADQSGLEEFMGGVVAADDVDDPPSADQAGATYDWLSQCAALKGAMLPCARQDQGD